MGDRECWQQGFYIFGEIGRQHAQQQRELQSFRLLEPRHPSHQQHPKSRQTRSRHLDVAPSQASTLHPRHLPPLRTPLEYLPSAISLLPHPLTADHSRYEPCFDFETSGAPRLSFRFFTVRYIGTMGKRGKQAREEAEHCDRACAVYHFEYRIWVLDKYIGGNVLAGSGWYRKRKYGRHENDDGGDCQGEEIPESGIPASAFGFQLGSGSWPCTWRMFG